MRLPIYSREINIRANCKIEANKLQFTRLRRQRKKNVLYLATTYPTNQERIPIMKNNKITNWNELPVLLDVKMIALIFDVTEVTVKHWIKAGILQGHQIGRKWYFEKDYIRSLVSNENNKSAA